MFARFFAAGAEKKNAYRIYQALVTQARSSRFYADWGVPDTVEGRFDMILLHLFLVDSRLEKDGVAFVRLRRFIQEVLVSDMDRSFRELGVGDMSVGKEMKKVGAALMGRKAAYSAAFTAEQSSKAVAQAVQKNIYRGEEHTALGDFVSYIERTRQALDALQLSDPRHCVFEFAQA